MTPWLGVRSGVSALLSVCLMACAATGRPESSDLPAAGISVWSSSSDQSRKLAHQPGLTWEPVTVAEPDDIVIDPNLRGPSIVGFGAAMTDSSAYLFQNVLTRPERDALFADLFGAGGLGLSLVRVPIGASDFSLEHYSLADMPDGQVDPALASFSMGKPRQAQIPALQAARKVNPRLTLMASPWSAPGWMKTTGSLIKGRLKPEHYGVYARYFVRYLDAMAAAGVPVRYVSMQNEPDFEPTNYPGMRAAPAERAAFIGGYLGPALAAREQPVGILEWDHNWDKPEQPLAVLGDPAARAHIAGVAWHCYGGDAAVMARVKAAYPDKELFFSECSGGDWSPKWGDSLGWMTDNLIIAPLQAGGRGSMLWNLALDENAGPHLGGCGDCRAVVIIDSKSHAVSRNVEYYVLGHISRFARPGAQMVAARGGPAELAYVIMRNLDRSLVLLAHNRSDAALPVTVRAGTLRFRTTMPAGEVMTFVWRQGSGAT